MTHLLTVDLGAHTLGQTYGPEAHGLGSDRRENAGCPQGQHREQGQESVGPQQGHFSGGECAPSPLRGVGESECPGCQVAQQLELGAAV